MKRLIPFEKYEAAGNDFIILDFFEYEWVDLSDRAMVSRMCNRHFGIGADGLIAVVPESSFDFRMKYLNADGKFSSFCGNGARAASLYMSRKLNKADMHFIAADGPHTSKVEDQGVKVKMKDISGFTNDHRGILVDSGSPHLIVEVENPMIFPVKEEGRKLRQTFAEGVNVNFVHYYNDLLYIATYERGVEDETLACGTGITAAAYAYGVKSALQGDQNVKVQAKGGELQVSFRLYGKYAMDVYLYGPVRLVYSGFYSMQ